MDHSSNIDPTPSVKMSSVSTAHTGTAPPGLRLDTQLLYTLHCTDCTVCTVQCRRHRLGLGCDKDRARHLSAVCVYITTLYITLHCLVCLVLCVLTPRYHKQWSALTALCVVGTVVCNGLVCIVYGAGWAEAGMRWNCS